MNKVILVLAAVCVALLVMIYVRSQRADALLESAQKETLSVSNHLSEAQIKVNHQERVNAALQSQLIERNTSLTNLANTVGQCRAILASTQAELAAARAELPPVRERAAAIAVERDGFSNRVETVQLALEESGRELQAARERAVALQADLADLSHRLADDQLERSKLENQLNDPPLLEARLREARQKQAHCAAGRTGKPGDLRQPLQLQPDGTVALNSPPAATKRQP